MRTLFQISAAAILAVLGAYVILLNYAVPIRWFREHKHHSLIPFFGGICLSISMLIWPKHSLGNYAWIPLVIDLGCAYLVVSFLYAALVLKAFKK